MNKSKIWMLKWHWQCYQFAIEQLLEEDRLQARRKAAFRQFIVIAICHFSYIIYLVYQHYM